MLRYVLRRGSLLWIPSVLLVMLAVYALAFYGAGDPIKLIFLRAPGDVAYDPATHRGDPRQRRPQPAVPRAVRQLHLEPRCTAISATR